MPLIVYFLLSLISTFVLTVISVRFLIPKLKSHKMGQKILDIGPRWHKSKEGTPTMGGLSFIFASLIVAAVSAVALVLRSGGSETAKFLLTFLLAFSNGLIGLLDDYLKVFKKQNEGLKAPQKYFLQLIVCGMYLFFMSHFGFITTEMPIPFTDIKIELGIVYYVIAMLLLTGIVNSVNLADGIDGLAATESAAVGAFFAVVFFTLSSTSGAILSALLIGGCLGFLTYNFYPAKIFMGDTGSLFLGGLVVGLAFLADEPLIILIAGFMYVIESISVILQVGCYKLTHKRIFKMSPIHHHFEKCGWSEIKIVSVFGILTALFCVISYFGIV
ncbi:MAG: phospho-N-acetylmuramoyl-pentapeptide-transferase [Firmicutes bacterium]|nr:phospho-N-acetylmuramoyl-pentapeptide-transferase [Bacillota bacterium]